MSDSSTRPALISRLSKGLVPIEDAANMLAAAAIFALMVLGVLQIVMRTVFNNPVTGYIDLVELSMASMAFLGVAYSQRLGAHIRMELLIGRLRGRALWAVETFGVAVAMVVVGVLIWYGAAHFIRSYTLGDTTIDAEFPVWPSKLLVPVAFSILFLRLALQFWGALRLFIDPKRDRVGVVTVKEVAQQAQEEIHEIMGDSSDAGEKS